MLKYTHTYTHKCELLATLELNAALHCKLNLTSNFTINTFEKSLKQEILEKQH